MNKYISNNPQQFNTLYNSSSSINYNNNINNNQENSFILNQPNKYLLNLKKVNLNLLKELSKTFNLKTCNSLNTNFYFRKINV
jgi:sialic acid synthase SpsE